MTWHWLICFSLLSGALLSASMAQSGSLKGTVAIAGPHSPASSSGPTDVVLWLEPLDPAAAVLRPEPARARIVQKNKQFLPHLLALPVGSTVDFPNFDPIFHNAFSNYNGQIFDVGLYPPGSSRSVVFRHPGVVRVFCNIHSSMAAVIVVLPSPYFTAPKPDGVFTFTGVPPGPYRLGVYYERATDQTLAALTRTVYLSAAPQETGVLTISETGYLPQQHHLNKYGKPYGASPDAGTYPGARP